MRYRCVIVICLEDGSPESLCRIFVIHADTRITYYFLYKIVFNCYVVHGHWALTIYGSVSQKIIR